MKRPKILKNPPLVEAIFELRWNPSAPNTTPGAGTSLLLGSLYERLKPSFPIYEALPSAQAPEGLLPPEVVQHRFRKVENGWPLVQLGAGILTINETTKYEWPAFQKSVEQVLESFFKVQAQLMGKNRFEAHTVVLRYINAIEFDFKANNINEFLGTNLKFTNGVVYDVLSSCKIGPSPINFDSRWSFPTENSKSIVTLRVAKAKNKEKDKDALLWEILIEARDVKDLKSIKTWLNSSHKIIEDCFFTIASEELVKRFA